jgi:hypothetical protein
MITGARIFGELFLFPLLPLGEGPGKRGVAGAARYSGPLPDPLPRERESNQGLGLKGLIQIVDLQSHRICARAFNAIKDAHHIGVRD